MRKPVASRKSEARSRAVWTCHWIVQVPIRYRAAVRAIRRFTVQPVLPPALAALGELAGNLRWSWHPETQDVFAAVDPEAWEAAGHDPSNAGRGGWLRSGR